MVSENVVQFFLAVAVSSMLGTIIGFLCRKRILIQLLLSIVVSALNLVVGAWMAGTLSNQISLDDPIGSLYWISPYYVYFLLAPTAVFATVVGWLRRKRVVSKKE